MFKKKLISKKLKNFFRFISLFLGVFLVFILVKYLIKEDYIKLLSKLTVKDYIVSFVLLMFSNVVSGFQLRMSIEKTSKVQLSIFDAVTLPMVQNFWGYIIPFQGSFIYGATFLKLKYKTTVKSTFSVYLFIILVSLMIGSLVGFVYALSTDKKLIWVYSLMFLTPMFIIISNNILLKLKTKYLMVNKVKNIISSILQSIIFMSKDIKFSMKIIVLDLIYVFAIAYWSFYLSEAMSLEVPLWIFILLSFFMKLTLLAKLTPGNLGIIQIYAGGFLAIYGFSPQIGILISTTQLAFLVLMSFPIAIIISIYNLVFLKRSEIKI
jgi:hypothetical protein